MYRRHLRQESRGQALVEFALIVPVFILLLVGLFDLGRGVFAFNTISNAAREAARVAIVDQDCTTIKNEAIKQAVSLGIAASDVSVYIWDYTPANAGDFTDTANHRRACGATPGTTECPQTLPVANEQGSVSTGCVVEVLVNYQYSAATPIIGKIVGTFTMSAKSREPVERRCNSSWLTPPATCQQP
jgi:Flp pilus assembly protein TadG